jgi:flagellar basal-body rod protein FlgG
MRVAEFGRVHRHEKSGVTHGLFRVRTFVQDDAHIFCTEDQIEEQIKDVIDQVFFTYKTFGFKDFMVETTAPRLEQGSLRTTENPLNIALRGDGFLRVQTDQGVLYTRNGDLTVGRDGTLTTLEGWPVLGKSGPIQVPGSTVRITEDGQIFDVQQGAGADQNVSVGTLDLVRFPPETAMNKARNGYFSPADAQTAPLPASDCTVHQGVLEQANFNVVEEMTQMIDTIRTFESYQKILQTFDQIDSQLTNKLANA